MRDYIALADALNIPPLEGWLTMAEACASIGISDHRMRDLLASGRIVGARRLGPLRTIVLPADEVELLRSVLRQEKERDRLRRERLRQQRAELSLSERELQVLSGLAAGSLVDCGSNTVPTAKRLQKRGLVVLGESFGITDAGRRALEVANGSLEVAS